MARVFEGIQSRFARYRSGKNANEQQERGEFRRSRLKLALRGLALLACLVFVIIPPLFLADPIAYAPLVTVVILVLVSFVYLRILKATLRFDEGNLVNVCERGEEIEFIVKLENRSFLAHPRLDISFYITDIFGGYDALVPVVATLGPRESRNLSFGARFTHLGTYSAGIERIVVHDLLGLFSATLENETRHPVAVRPHLFDIGDVELSSVTTQESKKLFRPIVSDDMDYAGVREYQMGDPMKTVHWNLSARNPSGELMTRLFEVYANPGLAIVIDPSAPDGLDAEAMMCVFDGLVESAVSADTYAREVGVDCEIDYLDRDATARAARFASSCDYEVLVRNMQRVIAEGEGMEISRSAVDMLRSRVNSTHGQGNIAWCTSRLDEDAITLLAEAKMHRRNPLLFLALPPGLEGKQRDRFLAPLARLRAMGIAYYLVRSNENGTEVGGQ